MTLKSKRICCETAGVLLALLGGFTFVFGGVLPVLNPLLDKNFGGDGHLASRNMLAIGAGVGIVCIAMSCSRYATRLKKLESKDRQ